jgi:hypothetical protein
VRRMGRLQELAAAFLMSWHRIASPSTIAPIRSKARIPFFHSINCGCQPSPHAPSNCSHAVGFNVASCTHCNPMPDGAASLTPALSRKSSRRQMPVPSSMHGLMHASIKFAFDKRLKEAPDKLPATRPPDIFTRPRLPSQQVTN